MKNPSFWFALALLLIPTQAFGFALALDQDSASGTFFVVARVGETTTFTAFGEETTKKWLVLSPPKTTFKSVPRSLFGTLEEETQPRLHQMTEIDPCDAAKSVEAGKKPEQKYTPMMMSADAKPVVAAEGGSILSEVSSSPEKTLVSPDMQSYLDQGWVLKEIELENPGEGIQLTLTSERLEIPPRPATGAEDRGELSLIVIAASRMEPVNFKSQLPPTNLPIRTAEAEERARLDRLVAAVFAAIDKNEKGAFMTEFAMDMPRWDFAPPLELFSSEVLPKTFTVTRIRRLGDLGTFSAPIQLYPAFKMAGGDDVETQGSLRSGGYSAEKNDFKVRLVMHKEFDRSVPMECKNPVWDMWTSHPVGRIRGAYESGMTDEDRTTLFQEWLPMAVPEIYWSPESGPEAQKVEPKSPELESPKTASDAKSAGRCSGCASADSTSMLALVFALFFLRRRVR